jgi:pyrimidine-nucleoside phosphorylase
MQNVKKVGISLIGQTLNLAPADKKLYALRDTISCTESIPLISSSIMSKKIAAGASKIVLDVTCGNGAFMKNKDQAIELANMMKKIGELAQKETVCVITNMNEPLGRAVGNSLEVIEAIKALQGEIEEDVKEVVFTLGAYMLKLAGKGENIEENKQKIEEQIKNKKAFEKCKEWVQAQGGNISYLENLGKWEKAKYILPVIAQKEGYVVNLDAQKVGEISMRLGAGRIKKEDIIDPVVGVILEKKIGDKVEKGQILSYIYANHEEVGKQEQLKLQQVYEIGEEKIEKSNILAII